MILKENNVTYVCHLKNELEVYREHPDCIVMVVEFEHKYKYLYNYNRQYSTVDYCYYHIILQT